MKKSIIIGIFTVVLFCLWIYGEFYNPYDIDSNITYEKHDINKFTKEEQKFIKDFYEKNKSTISKGELFDMNYDFFNSIKDSKITVIKKTPEPIIDLKFFVYKDKEMKHEIGWTEVPLELTNDGALIPSIYYYYDGSDLYTFGRDRSEITVKTRLYELTILITYRGGEEVHHLSTNKETNICDEEEYYAPRRDLNYKISSYGFKKDGNYDEYAKQITKVIDAFLKTKYIGEYKLEQLQSKHPSLYVTKELEIELIDLLYQNEKFYWIFEVKKEDKNKNTIDFYYKMEDISHEVTRICF